MKKEKSILKILITNCLFLTVVCSGCKEIAFEREIKNWGVYGQQILLLYWRVRVVFHWLRKYVNMMEWMRLRQAR